VLFVCLDILAIFDVAVLCIVDAKSNDDGTRAEGGRHSYFIGKGIKPEDVKKDHFGDHFGREIVKRSNVVGTVCAILDRPNTSFNIGDVFVFAAYVKFRFEVGSNGAVSALGLRVTEDVLDPETMFAIDALNFSESLDERGLFLIGGDAGSDKF
jgi:hypothetical protein